MATRFDSWQPRPGTHSVGIGPALLAALDAYDGGPVQTPLTELYSFHYDQRPKSFNYRKFSTIKDIKQQGGQSTCTLEVDVANSEDRHLYNGSLNQAKDFQCALIFDEATKSFTFEKLDTCVDLKYDRTGVPANESEGVHGPQNDSPTSGITAVSSSPPTPPSQSFASDNVKIGFDIEVDEPRAAPPVSVPAAKPRPVKSLPARPSMGGKSVAVANVAIPTPAKGKGKRTRDALDDSTKDEAPRPTKRPPPPIHKTSGKSLAVAVAQPPPPPPPAPLALPKAPRRPPTPPTGARSPQAFGPPGAFGLSDDDDDEPPLSTAPKTLSSGFFLEVDENPEALPVTGAHRPFQDELVIEEEPVNMDTIFDDLDDADGEVDDDEDGEEAEEDDDDGFGQELLEAFNQEEETAKPPPVSLNAFAAGDDPDDWEESSEEESD